MPLQIRQAAQTDAAAACDILRRSITELCEADHHRDTTLLGDWLANKTPGQVASWISDPGNMLYVAETEGVLAGVAGMTTGGKITLNYVSPDFRFRGVSKALLAKLESRARELGLMQCHLESTKTAERFYRAAGFHDAVAENGQCGAASCRAMVKDLAAAGYNPLNQL